MRKSLGAALLLVVVGVAACQGSSVPPGECVGTYSWNAGSLPMPYNYSWALELHDGGTADFRLSADGAEDGPLFEENGFDVAVEDADALCAAIADIPTHREQPAGGSTSGWKIGGMEGHSATSKDFQSAVDAAMTIIGQPRFDEAKAAHDAWAEEFELE